jgi:hypothetical protein
MKTGIGLALGLLVLLFLALVYWLAVLLILSLVRIREIVLLIGIILLLVRRIIYKSLYQAPVSILAMKRIIVIIILSLGPIASY